MTNRRTAERIRLRIEARQARENVEIDRWMHAVYLVSQGMDGVDAMAAAGLIFDDCESRGRAERRSKAPDVRKR